MQDQRIFERKHVWLGDDSIRIENIRISCNAPGFVFGGPLTMLASGAAGSSANTIDILHTQSSRTCLLTTFLQSWMAGLRWRTHSAARILATYLEKSRKFGRNRDRLLRKNLRPLSRSRRRPIEVNGDPVLTSLGKKLILGSSLAFEVLLIRISGVLQEMPYMPAMSHDIE